MAKASTGSVHKVGDTVRLKAGGPNMTVDRLVDGGVWCTWFAGKKREREHFSDGTLVAVVDGPDEKDE